MTNQTSVFYDPSDDAPEWHDDAFAQAEAAYNERTGSKGIWVAEDYQWPPGNASIVPKPKEVTYILTAEIASMDADDGNHGRTIIGTFTDKLDATRAYNRAIQDGAANVDVREEVSS
jgi:hypothetical protein